MTAWNTRSPIDVFSIRKRWTTGGARVVEVHRHLPIGDTMFTIHLRILDRNGYECCEQSIVRENSFYWMFRQPTTLVKWLWQTMDQRIRSKSKQPTSTTRKPDSCLIIETTTKSLTTKHPKPMQHSHTPPLFVCFLQFERNKKRPIYMNISHNEKRSVLSHGRFFHSCRHIGQSLFVCWELIHFIMQCSWKQCRHSPCETGHWSPG